MFQVARPEKCIFCMECKKTAESFDLNQYKNYISIGTFLYKKGKKKDKFIFTVESVGQLPAATIVKNSMIVLRKKLQDLQERIN